MIAINTLELLLKIEAKIWTRRRQAHRKKTRMTQNDKKTIKIKNKIKIKILSSFFFTRHLKRRRKKNKRNPDTIHIRVCDAGFPIRVIDRNEFPRRSLKIKRGKQNIPKKKIFLRFVSYKIFVY